MTIVLELPTELEKRLNEEASRRGQPTDQFVVGLLQSRLRLEDEISASESFGDAAKILERINETGMSEAEWQQFDRLTQKREAEELSPAEHQQLLEFSERLESHSAQRLRYLYELSKLTQKPVRQLLQELELQPRPYGV